MSGILNAYSGGTYSGLPGAPTIGTATATGSTTASVAFTAPTNTGGLSITGYQVLSSPGSITATGASSPITVTGLTAATSYTFQVRAQNSIGYGSYSGSSNSITTSAAPSSQSYTTAGTYSWVAPTGVTSVSAVAVGGGGGTTTGSCYCYRTTAGGGGGDLGYKNSYSVTPGNSYTVVVGGQASDSYFVSTLVAKGGGGQNGTNVAGGNKAGGAGGTHVGDGGGNGGSGGLSSSGNTNMGIGGGGAGGYSGNGGDFGTGTTPYSFYGRDGSGGGGGGGGGGIGLIICGCCVNYYPGAGAGGGGVGLFGQGSNGAGGTSAIISSHTQAYGGGGGSGGSSGSNGQALTCGAGGAGGGYGGGRGSISIYYAPLTKNNQSGTNGAVRIVWPGNTRTFPSTCVGSP